MVESFFKQMRCRTGTGTNMTKYLKYSEHVNILRTGLRLGVKSFENNLSLMLQRRWSWWMWKHQIWKSFPKSMFQNASARLCPRRSDLLAHAMERTPRQISYAEQEQIMHWETKWPAFCTCLLFLSYYSTLPNHLRKKSSYVTMTAVYMCPYHKLWTHDWKWDL